MSEEQAQEILNTLGPWSVTLDGSETHYTNGNGDVLTVESYTHPGYPDCAWDTVRDYTFTPAS